MEALINELPKQNTLTGVVLILLALTLTALIYLARLVYVLQNKRLEDAKNINTTIAKPLGDLAESGTQMARFMEQVRNDLDEIRRQK